jgi:uncharacterized membrane protein
LDPIIQDWVSFIFRWLHVIAAITWIGNSFYFMWLDAHLEVPKDDDPNLEGHLWMVHSGGFYNVQRRKITPETMPNPLHWFFWEATFTLITGLFMLGLVYYMKGAALLIDPSIASLSSWQAIGASLSLLVGCWLLYDFMWQRSLFKKTWFAHTVSSLSIGLLAWGLCHLYSGRGAFIHLGAIFGTIMVLNVWVRILPSQRQMLAATKRGQKADFSLAKIAKRRSVHNSYLSLPVLFTMLSNHLPYAYQHAFNWVILLLLVSLGVSVRYCMIARNRGQKWHWALGLVGLNLALIALVNTWNPQSSQAQVQIPQDQITQERVDIIINTHCLNCHADNPVNSEFGPAPKGLSFDQPNALALNAERIKLMSVTTQAMPLGNRTKMSPKERLILGSWLDLILDGAIAPAAPN